MKNYSIFGELVRNTVRLTGIVWKDKKGLILRLSFLFLLISAAPFLQSGARGLLINDLVHVANSKTADTHLFWLLALLIVAGFVPSILFAVQNYFSKLFWFYLEKKFDLAIIKKKGELDVATHENPAYNDLFIRVSENGIYRLHNFIDRQFFILQNTIEVGIASLIIGFSQWWVLVVILAGTLPELITEARYGHRTWGIYGARAEIRRKYWNIHSYFDRLSGIVELKLFQNIPYFLSSIRELFESFQKEEHINERKRLRQSCISLGLSQSAIALATIWFVLEVVRGNLQLGTLVFILASIADLRQSLSSLFSNLGRQYQDSLFVTDVFRLLDIRPVIPRPEKGIILDPNATPEIVFENVSFAYPGTNKRTLENFSLAIAPGEKVALVGVNGAGKTTLVKLLCRFYDPDHGRILIDGHDIKKIDLESWYRKLGILFQDYENYHFLVKEAVAVGRAGEQSDLEKVMDAAKASEADVFIAEWEEKYNQQLGQRFTGGVTPSIGQWQKLALARTFYRDPRVLVLDEPTSAIDAESEKKIFDKIEALPKDRTVILISHRFSTVRQADKIGVIERGRLKEWGRHEDLLTLKGTYARLFSLQAKGYK